jgi:tetratricopeptide (TPR) repeat protein
MELASELGSLRDEARAAFLLGLVKHYRGDSDEARRLNLQARDWLERTGERYFQMQNFRALGLYALVEDDLEAAERWLREAIPVALEEGGRYMFEVYRFLAETLVRQGRLDDAATLIEFAAPSVPKEDLVAEAYVLLARAALATAQNDRRALDMYAEAIDSLEQHLLRVEVADARITFAGALRHSGDHEAARTQLTIARAEFGQMGASGSCRQIDDMLERLAGEAGKAGPALSA